MITLPSANPLQEALADIRSLPTPYPVYSGEERIITELFLGAVVGNLKADILRGEALEGELARAEMKGALKNVVKDHKVHGSVFVEELILRFPPPPPLPTYQLAQLRDPDFVVCEGPFRLDASYNSNPQERFSGEDLRELIASYPNIQGLDLSGRSISAEGLSHLTNLEDLQFLIFQKTDLAHQDILRIAQLLNLKSLALTPPSTRTDEDLFHLSNLTKLETLDLFYLRSISDRGLDHLTKLENLHYLTLTHCLNVTDAGFAQLSRLRNLRSLNLQFVRITDHGLAELLSHFVDLESLTLSVCRRISSAGFGCLRSLTSLRHLDLSGSSDDGVLANFPAFAYLQSLNLSQKTRERGVTNTGLRSLPPLPSLEFLDLSSTQQITNEALGILAEKFPNLKSLNIDFCDQITEEATRSLLEQLPNLSISHRLDN